MSDDTRFPLALTQGQVVFTGKRLTRTTRLGDIDFIEGTFTSSYAQFVNRVADDASTAVYIEGPREVQPAVFDAASIRIGVDQ